MIFQTFFSITNVMQYVSGLPDQVAHRIPEEELPEGEEKRRYKFAYHTRTMEQPVFLHNLSVLKSDTPPEWVVYQEIYEVQGKMYMRGVTAIDPAWLPEFCPLDCNLSKPLSKREPFYDPERGQILTYRSGTYGERGWVLPLVTTVHPNTMERTKFFAKFFLEGLIFPELKDFSEELLSPSVAMVRSWGNLHLKRTKPFFEMLLHKCVDEKDKFETALSANPKFLLKEYLLWHDEGRHQEIRKIWPSLAKQ